MKCHKCAERAAIHMRQHKLALCAEHYLEWLPQQTQRFIEKYRMFGPDDRILVAVSGGKDSLSLWDVLLRLDYKADGLYIGLGIDGGIAYSAQSYEKVLKFYEDRVKAHPGIRLEVVDVARLYGASVPEAAHISNRGRGKPCSVCGLIKRHIMNRMAYDGGYDALATGHNLDDEVAVLMQNTLHWQTGYLARQAPVLEATHPGLARKVKPFCRFYERETAAYALLRGIDYIYEECPYAEGSNTIYYKELLNQLESARPGAKLQFYLSFLEAKESGLFDAVRDEVVLNPCAKCGQPTSAPGECAFCRLWERVNAYKAEGRPVRVLA
ncbi:MAG: TIGR00269 family protein [Chloroflexota bacterium]